MGLAEEILQTIASDYQMTLIADNHIVALELNEKFSHAWARSADQISQILVSRSDTQACAAPVLEPEVLAKFKQNQGQPLLERATHEVRAAQLHQIPSAHVTGRHPFEVVGGDAERNLDEGLKINRSNLTVGDRFAAKVV